MTRERGLQAVSWVPLIVGAMASYGPVGLNYGFALYFLNYRHGFVKRGLVGELVAWLGMLPRWKLLGIEYACLAAAFALTYVVFRSVLFGSAGERRLAAVLLSAPAALPHLGYLFAQPDVTLYLLVMLCVWMLLQGRAGVAAAASLLLCCMGLLGHEAFSLMFYPLVFALLVDLCARRRLAWWWVAAHAAVMIAVFVAVMHWGGLKISPDAMLAEAQARTNVGVQRQVYDVMASGWREQQALVRRMYTPGVLWVLAMTLVLAAPYFWLLARLLGSAMRGSGFATWRRWATAGMFCLPLVLCAMGHDTTRWIGAMCLDATLFILYLYLADTEGGPVRRELTEWANGPGVLVWMAYLVAIGPFGATGIRSAEQIVGAWLGY